MLVSVEMFLASVPAAEASAVVSIAVVSGWDWAAVVGAMVSATVVWVLVRSIFYGDFLQPETIAAVVSARTHRAAPFREPVLYVIISVSSFVVCICADAIIADFAEKG